MLVSNLDHTSIVKFLIKHGADTNIGSSHNETPLFLAIHNKGMFRKYEKKFIAEI